MDLHQYTAPTSQAWISLQTCKSVVRSSFPVINKTYLFDSLTSHQIVTPATYDHRYYQDCLNTFPYQGN